MTTNRDRTDRLLRSYRLNMDRGAAAVRRMILEDIRRLSEMGAQAYAADLRQALFRFDGETLRAAPQLPASHCAPSSPLGAGV